MRKLMIKVLIRLTMVGYKLCLKRIVTARTKEEIYAAADDALKFIRKGTELCILLNKS